MQILFDDITPIRRARSTDPETSHTAAMRASAFSRTHAGRILLALQLHGPRSPKELEQLIGLTVVQIDRRTSELERQGFIRVVRLDDGADVVRDGCRVFEAIPR